MNNPTTTTTTLPPAPQQPILFPCNAEQLDKWCVYEVTNAPGGAGRSLWVGCCKLSGVLLLEEFNRTACYREMVKGNPQTSIVLIGTFINETQARRMQFEYRKARNPQGNAQFAESMRDFKGRGLGPVKCIETGQSWRNSAEAARANGVAASTMSNHLNKRFGYSHVNGLTFVRAFVTPEDAISALQKENDRE